jgi:propane monooxygenase small subunit
MSAQASRAATKPAIFKSGAAGAAIFPGSDSRKYNYFEPKGRKATHYEDMTVDVQPDPERYLLQDWIISFPDGTPTYCKDWTAAKSSNWHKFRAVDQEWERTHYQRQSTICGMVQNTIENGRKSGAPARFDPAWVKILQNHLGAYKHAEFGLGTSTMQAQRYGYTQMVNNAILTNSSYKLRFAQDITLYLSEIGLDLPGFDVSAGKQHWLEDPIWQGVRKSVESIMGSNDYLKQYFATNVVFEPLVGELFRSGFLMQAASAQNDFITPAVVSAAEADYERNLANTVELFHILGSDPTYGTQNVALFDKWLAKHADLALDAANHLQPIWSQPRVKVAAFGDALAHAKNRIHSIAAELGLKVPANLAS